MKPISEIEIWLESVIIGTTPPADTDALLRAGEDVLKNWIHGKGLEPTSELREGFRLLALQRQGAQGDPSFNACRETCRELVYHYNLVNSSSGDESESSQQLAMMALVANHLCLFVSGKMQVAELGEFCCSSKPIRHDSRSDLENIDAHG